MPQNCDIVVPDLEVLPNVSNRSQQEQAMINIRFVSILGANGRKFLFANALSLRTILSDVTGYDIKEISITPEHIPPGQVIPAFNLKDVEFVLDVGTKVSTEQDAEKCAEAFLEHLLRRCEEAKKFTFGVLAQGKTVNGYTSHKAWKPEDS